MMNLRVFVIAFIAILSAVVANGQSAMVLRGQIIDQNTGEPLSAASIVAQNTTVGTLTDSSGFFRLRLPAGGYKLTISYTGYQAKELHVNQNSAGEEIIVTLEPHNKPLDEVSVVLDLELKDGWEDYGQYFIENFIGRTNFSKACIIRNPEVLKFYLFKRRRTLKVMAKEPLVVENFALGYILKFSIDSFVSNFGTRTTMFVGYPVFEEMNGTPEQVSMWVQNRKSIYKGSALHFMRTLYNRQLAEEGYELKFILKTPTEEIFLSVKDLYGALNFDKDASGTVNIRPFQQEVAVIYHRDAPEISYLLIEPTANHLFQISTFVFDPEIPIKVEKNGYFYPQTEVFTNGYLGFKKIGDMLPYDYEP